MAWLYIFIAGMIEAIWPFVLKSDAEASQWWAPLKGVIIAIPIMFLLAWAMKQLSAGSTYATFVGIGTAATAVIGISLFGESPNLGRVISIVLVVIGVVGVNLFSVK
jgi:quaternary ammonium compound-resistance protein SugE